MAAKTWKEYKENDMKSYHDVRKSVMSFLQEEIERYQMLLRVTKHSKKREKHLSLLEFYEEAYEDYLKEEEQC